MALKIFVFVSLVLAIIFYFLPIDKIKKDLKKEDIALFIFENPVMYSLDEILKKEGLNYSQVAAIGDDLNDLKMLKKAGLSFAPQNAHELIKNSVNVVCHPSGGSGSRYGDRGC